MSRRPSRQGPRSKAPSQPGPQQTDPSPAGSARARRAPARSSNPETEQEQIFRVSDELAGQALSAALRTWLAGRSWSQVRALISARRVMVSGNLCVDAARKLRATEVVKLLAHPAALPPREEDVRLRYLDAHLVVVEKPAGMTTLRHPEERRWPQRRKQLQPTLDESLPRLIAVREGRPRRGHGPLRRVRPVHRLDRETSGLMVFARTVDAERQLGLQFRAHALDRVYLAVAQGEVGARTIESHLVDDRGDGRRGSTTDRARGKRAVTHVRPLEALRGATLLECRLETGRTHQIRIHLSEQGHPLCGDKVYRGPFPGPPMPDLTRAPRVALHAAELAFEHPITGEPLRFEMPLPDDLAEFIARLRGENGRASPRSR